MEEFAKSLATVFIAELGDKTQLVALSLATQFSTGVTLLGILTATLIVHIISVALGGAAGAVLPTDWINLLAGLAFVGFGWWTLRGDCLDGDECPTKRRSPFWTVFITFFLAELGDKTMLSTVALAATATVSLLPIVLVWLGSSMGMVLSDGLAILVGKVLGGRLPERAIKIGASLIFFAFGLIKGYEGAAKLPVWASVAAIIVAVAMSVHFIKEMSRAKANKEAAITDDYARKVS